MPGHRQACAVGVDNRGSTVNERRLPDRDLATPHVLVNHAPPAILLDDRAHGP